MRRYRHWFLDNSRKVWGQVGILQELLRGICCFSLEVETQEILGMPIWTGCNYVVLFVYIDSMEEMMVHSF